MEFQDELVPRLKAAIRAYELSDLNLAESILNNILDVYPHDSDALHLLGCINKDKGDLSQSIYFILKSIDENNKNPIAYLNLGKIFLITGQYVKAVDAFKQSLVLDECIAETWFCLGNALYRCKNEVYAATSYRNCLRINGNHTGSAVNLGILLTNSGDFEEAEELFENVLRQYPENGYSLINYGKLLSKKGEHLLAIDKYKTAFSLQDNCAELYLNFAHSLKELGLIAEAEVNYRNAIKEKSNFKEAYFGLGNLMRDTRKPDAAIKYYRKALELDPDCIVYLSVLAAVLVEQENFDEAISLYQRVLDIDAQHANARNGIGWAFLKSGKFQEASDYHISVSRKHPDSIEVLFFLFEGIRLSSANKVVRKFSYRRQFLDDVLNGLGLSKVVAFGDSHVLLFDDCSDVEVNHVGASTAYTLMNDASSTGARHKVFTRLQTLDTAHDAILLCFGEVDVRANILRYCYQQNISISECVSNVVSRYIDFAMDIKKLGFVVAIYGGYGAGENFFAFGSSEERNFAAGLLHKRLSNVCFSNQLIYFSLFDSFYDQSSCETNLSYMSDGFHLNSTGLARRDVHTMLFQQLYLASKPFYSTKKRSNPSLRAVCNIYSQNKVVISSLNDLFSSCSEYVNFELDSLTFDLNSLLPLSSIIICFRSGCYSPSELWLDGVAIDLTFQYLEYDKVSLNLNAPIICRFPTMIFGGIPSSSILSVTPNLISVEF